MPPAAEKAQVVAMTAPAARKLFGTDGVRGVANVDPMTPEMALRLGPRRRLPLPQQAQSRARSHRHRQGHAPLGLHARDGAGRRHLLDGRRRHAVRPAADAGHRVHHLVDARRRRRGDLARRHNPYQDNGIKFFARDGFKLPDEIEAEIEELIASRRARRSCAPHRRRDRQGDPASTTRAAATSCSCKNTLPARARRSTA